MILLGVNNEFGIAIDLLTCLIAFDGNGTDVTYQIGKLNRNLF